MKISKYQRRALHRARELRDKPFPIFGSMLRSWKIYLIFGVLLSIYAWWAWSMGVREASYASLGLFAGLVARDLTWFRIHAHMWPINVQVTDWSKVDELMKSNPET